MPTVAENIVSVLRHHGVQRVYGLPGDSLNGFTDAIRRDGDIRWMHVRHEEAAAFAASAEAELTGELTVCAGSCGPGNLHLINGLYDANRSRVPVLAIAAHIPTAEIGSTYFQETHPQELFRECSVYVEYVADPAQMPRLLEIAMREAIEKRGVAVLVIPGDVLLAKARNDRVATIARTTPRITPSDDELRRTADVLNAAEKVTILAGAGVADAHDEVVELARRLQAPIVHALRGKEHIEWENPFDVGMTGLLGFSSGYRAMEDADVVLMLGTDFPYQQFYPSRAKHIQVDIRGEQLGRRHPIDIGLVGTVRDTARAHPSAAERGTIDAARRRRAFALPDHPVQARRSRGAERRRQAAAPPVRRTDARPSRRRRRGLHPGRGLSRGVGVALPHHDERTPAHRVVRARDHGERPIACDRRASGLPRPADRGSGRRRRSGDAAAAAN